nr:hypothetical protein CFP56_41374 [Quercus suber]
MPLPKPCVCLTSLRDVLRACQERCKDQQGSAAALLPAEQIAHRHPRYDSIHVHRYSFMILDRSSGEQARSGDSEMNDEKIQHFHLSTDRASPFRNNALS